MLEAVLSQVLIPRIDGHGRVVATEIMLANYGIKNLIREKKVHQIPSIIETSSQEGMQTLDQSLVQLVSKGMVSLDEALLRAQRPDDMRKSLVAYSSYGRRSERIGNM